MAKPGGARLNTQEIMDALGVSRQAISRAIKRGCPVYPVPPPKGKGGKPRNMFHLREVEDWFAANVRGGPVKAARALSPPIVPPPAIAEKKPAQKGSAAKGLKSLTDATDVSSLLEMRERLEMAEKTTFTAWAKALAENRERLEEDRHSAAELNVLQKTWQDIVERRRKLEKELPLILYRRGRYVDAQIVGKVIAGKVQAMVMDLDGVGIKVAPRCVGKSARDIRNEIDRAVKDARRHLQELLRPDAAGGGNG